jgi:hypothetical protein
MHMQAVLCQHLASPMHHIAHWIGELVLLLFPGESRHTEDIALKGELV